MQTSIEKPPLVILGLWGVLFAAATVPVFAETVGNGIYEANVRARSEGVSAGSWNVVTSQGHDAGPGQDLTYSGLMPTTNFSSLRIFRPGGVSDDFTFRGRGGGNNLDGMVESEGPSPLADPGTGWRTVWRLDEESLRIVQDVLVVGDDMDDSAVYHTVEIESFGSDPVRLGWRNLHDWFLTSQGRREDGPTNTLEGGCGTAIFGPTRDEFSHQPVAAGWVRMDLPNQKSSYTPLLSLGFDPGFVPSLPVTVPDEYAYVRWGRAKESSFDDSIQGDTDLSDSAGLSWFGRDEARARELEPGESIRFTQVLFAFVEEGCPPTPTCADVPHGLVGWWPFNEEDQGEQGGAFEDLAGNNQGNSRFPPSAIDGKVGRAARFDGLLEEVEVGDSPQLDFPAGVDLSIDFWIRTDQTSGVILEKRSSAPAVLGYQVFLSGGRVGLQLAEGSGSNNCSSDPSTSACTNYLSNTFIADDQWHLVAVTVDRDDSNGGIWYLDGLEVDRFDPTLRTGSLENQASLLIGGRDPNGPDAGAPFRGDLDEVEIARRVLSPGEILAIYQADRLGKCSASIDVTWDIPKCLNLDSVEDEIRICNHGGTEARYIFDFDPLPAGSEPVPGAGCSVDGPTQFDLLSSEPLVVSAGDCATARYRIRGVSSAPAFEGLCFQATATDLVSGQSIQDAGSVRPNSQICCFVPDPVTPTAIGETSLLRFELEDTGFGLPTLDLRVSPPLSDDEGMPTVQLGDAPAGEAVDFTVAFDEDGAATLEVPVRLTENAAPLAFYDVLLSSLGQGPDPLPLVSASVVVDPDSCVNGLNGLCLSGSRFRVEARYRTDEGAQEPAPAIPLTSDTGFFWFFSDNNLEMVVKVLDGCAFNDRFWVFAAGLTDVEVEWVVTDLVTGESRTYANPLGTPFQPIQDTDAFATCDATDEGSSGLPSPDESALPISGATTPYAKVTELPLNANRFIVEAGWETASGETGEAEGVLLTSDTGYFWFFEDTNVELTVKVLDSCGFNDRYWVFAAGLTDVRVDLKVTDSVSGVSKTYVNPLGARFQPIQDTNAFAGCP